METRRPPVLWIAIVSLALMIALQPFLATRARPLVLVVAAVFNGLLLVGIYRGYPWAYHLTVIVVVLGVIFGFRKNAAIGAGTLLIDCTVLIPVLLAKSYFFRHRRSSAAAPEE